MIDINNLSDRQLSELNSFGNLFSYRHTKHSRAYLSCDYDITFVNKGNQAGGTALIGYGYVLRILGWHPIPMKNMVYFECPASINYRETMRVDPDAQDVNPGRQWSPKQYYSTMENKVCPCCDGEITKHERLNKIYRFASQNKPESKNNQAGEARDSSGEIKNTQYPEFTYWLPPFLLKKDITSRECVQFIWDIYGGDDIMIEYVGYNQQTQSVAGHKRASVWLDELAPERFYDEQPPRLMIEDGDINISYTPTKDNPISYYYDRIYEKAKVYYKSKEIRRYYEMRHKIKYPEIEFTNSPESVAVIQMATDDNPMLSRMAIDKKYAAMNTEDQHDVDMRRYGIFAAVTGKIYKQFSPRVHVVDSNSIEIPEGWTYFRSEDYHPTTDICIVWVALSPTNEMFIYQEMTIDPEMNTTLIKCERIRDMSGNRKYAMNVIDPFAAINQPNTGRSVLDDMNHYFREFKNQGLCSGGHWESANTKNKVFKSDTIRGREQLRLRMYNSLLCEKPFNNRVEKDGLVRRLPTVWVLDNCRQVISSLKKWRMENGKPSNDWSHYCTAIEFLLKDVRFEPRIRSTAHRKPVVHNKYFTRR